jgi:hypothetical protein
MPCVERTVAPRPWQVIHIEIGHGDGAHSPIFDRCRPKSRLQFPLEYELDMHSAVWLHELCRWEISDDEAC